jgi:hypothetical protein
MVAGNTERRKELMIAEGIDAVLALTAEDIRYVSGYPLPPQILRVLGAYSARLPADENLSRLV